MPLPTPPQGFLSLVQVCDNFRVPPLSAQQTSYLTEDLVPWHLTIEPSSSVIGLLRASIVKQLITENSKATRDEEVPWNLRQENGRTTLSFASWIDTPQKRTHIMKEMCERWRDGGLWPDIIGPKKWRGEMYPVYQNPFGKNDAPSEAELAAEDSDTRNYAFMMERSACALFGVVTYGIHMTIYEDDAESGCKIWVPVRAQTKQTWPGYLDNTVAGGIPSGLGVFESLIKEAMEEASIPEEAIREHAKAVGSVSYFFWCVNSHYILARSVAHKSYETVRRMVGCNQK
ncbi:hypothetical protein EW026_g2208 [Hermanssonia centrifuga]|uniref:Nudix hydrolase domain-containing protein n=1 Tax=Hermanssonia centrifuga TaxID=98765 RepID=A0A4S4KNY7_9APHY|nr:hypothetical protein EW026_g2208 [Hermanssonia centrifuga]